MQKVQDDQKKRQVSLALSKQDVNKLAILAERAGMSRSAFIADLIEVEYRRLQIVMQSAVER